MGIIISTMNIEMDRGHSHLWYLCDTLEHVEMDVRMAYRNRSGNS